MASLATSSWPQVYSKKLELFLARGFHSDLQNMSDKFPFLRAYADGQTILTDLDALYMEEEAYPDVHHHLDLFDVLMGLWIPGIICLFGIVGNLLCLWVLSRHHISIQGCSTFTSLKALAISDIVVLVGAILQQILPMLCEFLRRRDTFCLRYAGYIRVYSWPVVCIGQMTSIWTTVLVSAERFVAICASNRLPPSYSYSRRNWRVLLSISGIWIFSVLFNIPRFFEFVAAEELLDDGNTTKMVMNVTSIRSNGVYRYFYNTFLFCVVVYAIPLSILTCLNVRLVRTIHKAKSSWTKLNRNQKLELKTTKLPLLIVLVFFVCETESFLAFLLDAVFVNEDHPWLQVYTAVVNVLVVSNSAVNFLLMFFAGGRFRKMLLSALQCGDKKPLANHSWAGSTRNMRTTSSNQVAASIQPRVSTNRNKGRHRPGCSISFEEKEFDQNPGEDVVSIFKPSKGLVIFQRKSNSNAKLQGKLKDKTCRTVVSLL